MMITRCPACGTMFNVVADQLKVSQGWVRCGQCADVFDASLHLQDVNLAPQTTPESLAAQASLASPVAAPGVENYPPEESLLEDDFESSLRAAVMAAAAAKSREDVPPPLTQTAPAGPGPGPYLSAIAPTSADSANRTTSEEINAEESAAAADAVSFVKHARRQAFWKKLWVQVTVAALALLLSAGLLLQIAFQQRDQLVQLEPRLKPVAQALCNSLGCRLNPLKKIDEVVIDSSTFTKLAADSYKLSFSIKNLGAVPVAMPALEVTLTDTQDQALLRRVLMPAQFGVTTALLAAGGDFQGAIVLDVSAAAATRNASSISPRVAGYRLLAFYP